MSEAARRLGWRGAAAATLVLVAGTALILALLGQPLICECGTVKLWYPEPLAPETSQHITDWYSPSHLIHGILFFALGWLLFRRMGLPARFVLAVLVEAAWEVFENTPFIIERYREATIALDYYGDSIVNALSDIGWMMIGFAIAARAPVWLSVALVVVLELFVGWMIRDNLALNIIMLIAPSQAILDWQSGG